MKVVLFMAMTVNGMIARTDGSTGWSEEDWQSFLAMTKKVGNAIIGKNTYNVVVKEGGLLKGCLTVVMTHDTFRKSSNETLFTNKKPVQVLELLKNRGFDTTLVAGGGMVNASFLKENLIDEIYIDIEPKIFGRGIPLFEECDIERTLELDATTILNKSTVQLHYKVIK